MRFFVCAAQLSGEPVPEATLARLAAAQSCRVLRPVWQEVKGLSVLIHCDQADTPPTVAHETSLVAVGSVRLDNRGDLLHRTRHTYAERDRPLTDLELVLRLFAEEGDSCWNLILGDFAFVVWHALERSIIGVRDAFGVKTLYYCQQPVLVAFASHAESLASRDSYDVGYLTAFVANATAPEGTTAYAGINTVIPGTAVRIRNGVSATNRFWSPMDFAMDSAPVIGKGSQHETLRDLLVTAIRLRMSPGGDTWSMLSGGLDSSSIVSVAEHVAQVGMVSSGLGGTVTLVDTKGSGADEREYSDAVVHRYGLRNEQIVDYGYLDEDEQLPPPLDQPVYNYPYYARDRIACEVIAEAGGRSLLTGYGGDQVVMGNMFFFADWIAAGHVRKAVSEMLHRAALGRASFWQLALKNAVLPILPRWLRQHLVREHRVPIWVSRRMVRHYGLAAHALGHRVHAGPHGRKYDYHVATGLSDVAGGIANFSVFENELELRYPYLFRPLVEFALRLPPEMCVQPHARKWILREAMRGILPEVVRTRVGKGALFGSMAWGLTSKRQRIRTMLSNSILAELGCIDIPPLLNALEVAGITDGVTNGAMGSVIAAELWLQVRAGQWGIGKRTIRYTSRNRNTTAVYQ